MLAGGDYGDDDDGCSISGSHGVAVMVMVMMKVLMMIVFIVISSELLLFPGLSF